MAIFKQYDPGLVVVVFRGILIQGYADGEMVNFERTSDAFTMSSGAAGDVVRVRNRDKTGSVTITLQAESPTNDLLSAASALDEATGLGFGPLLVKNGNGTTLVKASVAWIRKRAPGAYGKDAGTREWVIDCYDLDPHIGGAVI